MDKEVIRLLRLIFYTLCLLIGVVIGTGIATNSNLVQIEKDLHSLMEIVDDR